MVRKTNTPDLAHSSSQATLRNIDDENTPLLSNNNSAACDPTTLYARVINEHLPWHKRPSALWLIPIFALAWISSGMLQSSLGQFQASLLCREYLNRHPSNTTLVAESSLSIALRPAPECEAPEIQAFTAEIMALVEVLGAIAGSFSVGYYSSLSDKHGRRSIMILTFVNTLLTLGAIVLMGKYWDSIGLPLMIVSGLVNGLLGGVLLGLTMCLAYAADCTDPAKRSLVFSWLHAGAFLGLAIGPYIGGVISKATGSILTVVCIDVASNLFCLLITILIIPESLPSKQVAEIRKYYEKPSKKDEITKVASGEHVAWHSHMLQALKFFKPNGRNTNLVLLASISFIQMLSYRGTLSVVVLYTNHMFQWTEYEDGIMFSLISLFRLITMLAILPILVYFHKRAFKKKQIKSQAKSKVSSYGGEPQACHSKNRDLNVQSVFNPNDPEIVSSVQSLGEAALGLALDDEDDDITPQQIRSRQISGNSDSSLSSDQITVQDSFQNSTPDCEPLATRTREEAFSDMKFDTWVIRLGFIINSVTYIGYGLAHEGWVFYIAVSLHALSAMSSPSLKSLLTSLVEPSQFGAALGAIQVVDSIASVFSPMAISWVYALTVKTMPEFVWYSCAFWTGICVVLSFMIRQKKFRGNFE